MANVPHQVLFPSCEAVNGIHPHDGDDAKNGNDAKNNRDEDKTEHFTVLLSGLCFCVGFPSSVP